MRRGPDQGPRRTPLPRRGKVFLRQTADMNGEHSLDEQATFDTERLKMRRWRETDARFHRRLWGERDERVPARRRITADGHPTIAELQGRLRAYQPIPAPGLFVVERLGSPDAVGYCGLVENSLGRPDEPELAFEFLRQFWGRGFATEASRAIVDRAAALGYDTLAATVREWNTASLTVLGKVGFVDTGEREIDRVHGDSLLLRARLHHASP